MKRLLLGAITLLALPLSGLNALATPFVFTYTGHLVTFTVPATDTYQILAFGAQGGDTNTISPPIFNAGGRGAEIGGDFSLTAGETLQIAVGGAGMPGGSGGGGSFVVGPGNAPLVIAGGGGGGGIVPFGVGGGGLTGPDGGGFLGGTGGNGGAGCGNPFGGGGGGGGFFSAGGDCLAIFSGPGARGGDAFPSLAGGSGGLSADGGFGGGGGGIGGGGGGYSGGSAGGCEHSFCGDGGGGGSFDAGTNQILVADFRTGNGEVVITELAAAVPEPRSIALLGVGLAVLAAIRRARRGAEDSPAG